MLEPKECAEAWKTVVELFTEKDERANPSETAEKIVNQLGRDKAVEVFATVAQLKKHDGRIYGENREWTNSICVNPKSLEIGHSNPMFSSKLDSIHTTHINQLITELRKGER